jgi:hypothetical protein
MENDTKSQVVTVIRSRTCNVCKKRITKKSKAVYSHWVKSDEAYTHIACATNAIQPSPQTP